MWRKIRVWCTRARWRVLRGSLGEDVAERMDLHPCVAHRGWSGHAPENTLAAFRLALEEPAVTWIELDVQLSKDGVPVVIHDSTLKRTTNGQGKVADWTAEQLGRLDAGSWFSRQYAGEGVPTLDQVMELSRGRCMLNVEIKGDSAGRLGLLTQRVLEVIRHHRMTDDVVITSFDSKILTDVRARDPHIRTGLIIDFRPADLIRTVRRLGASFLSIGHRHLSAALLSEAAAAGVDVMAWTVNDTSDLKRLARWPEPFLLCTNYPDRWLKAIAVPSDETAADKENFK